MEGCYWDWTPLTSGMAREFVMGPLLFAVKHKGVMGWGLKEGWKSRGKTWIGGYGILHSYLWTGQSAVQKLGCLVTDNIRQET